LSRIHSNSKYLYFQNTTHLNTTQRAYLELHFAVLLFGFTAILGDLITLSALVLVWWRMGITTASIPLLTKIKARLSTLPRSLILRYMSIGVLVALHWICFFGSVKLANASISLICMATTSFFTALIEPLVFRRALKWDELSLGLLMIPGIMLIVNNTEGAMILGILVGLMSAFLASLFAVLNKQLVDEAEPLTITFLELGSGWLFLSLVLPCYFYFNQEMTFLPQGYDWLWLIVLALLCTTLAYVLSLRALKHLSAFSSTLTINLEPVYGILLAWLLLDDAQELSPQFYVGCLLIIGAIFFHAFRSIKTARQYGD